MTGETEVSPAYRQGLARLEDGSGWIFSTNNGMYRTGHELGREVPPVERYEPAIPPELAEQGYNHLGDIDIADGIIWGPLERPDKTLGEQAMARYDVADASFIDAFTVPQHHAAWVSEGPDGVIWSADYFSDDTLLRYRFDGSALVPLEPLPMSQRIERIQGGDIAGGAMWLSTDDEQNGLYRVDLKTGHVQDMGSIGHVAGEGEGIDARSASDDSVLLRATTTDEGRIWVWAVDLLATPVDD